MARHISYRLLRIGLALTLVGGAVASVGAGCGGAADADLLAAATPDAGSTPKSDGAQGSTPNGDDSDDHKDADGTPTQPDPDGTPTPPDEDGGPPVATEDSGPGVIDAGQDSGPAPSPLDPTPGEVPCGSKSCNLKSKICCDKGLGGKWCVARDAEDKDAGDGCATPIACDEKADCPGNQVCCANQGNLPSTYCAATCTGGSFQVCQSADECATNACDAYQCTILLYTTVVHSCANPAAGLCTKK